MTRVRISALLVLAFALVIGAPVCAQKSKGGKTGKPAETKVEAYLIVQVDADSRVVKKTELDALKKKADSDFKSAMSAWNDAKKAALKDKKKFTNPSPKKSVVKQIAGPFKSESEAQAALSKLQEKPKGKGHGAG